MNERLEVLLSGVPDRCLNPAEEAELLTLLRRSPAARQLAARDRWMDRLVRESRRPAINMDVVMRAIDHGRVDLADRTMDRLGNGPVGPRRQRVRFADGWREFLAGLTRRPGWTWAAAIAVLGMVLGLAVLGRLDRVPAPVVIGHLTTVVGLPTLERTAGTPAPLPVLSDAPVHLGDRLETGDADKAEIRFLDGTTLRMGFNTAVTLGSPQAVSRNPQSPLVRPDEVHLQKGQVWTQVQKTTNAPPYTVVTEAATAIARGTEFGVKLQRVETPGTNAVPAIPDFPFAAVLTVKEGTVDFTNALGSVQATAMTESTARADSVPTEPRRLQTLQVVRLAGSGTWSLVTAPLDWPDAATRLVGGGGSAGLIARDFPVAAGFPAAPAGTTNQVRVARVLPDSPAARAGLQPGDFIIALDGRPVTGAGQLHRAFLISPDAAFTPAGPDPAPAGSLTLRRGNETLSVRLKPAILPAVLPGPALDSDQQAILARITRGWLGVAIPQTIGTPADGLRDPAVREIQRVPVLRAAAENNLGVLLELDDALGPAVRAYGRAVRAAPDVPLYHMNLGLALEKIGSSERAREELAHAGRLAPEFLVVRRHLAKIESLLGAQDRALAASEALVTSAPGEHNHWELRAQLLLKAGRVSEATLAARRAVELDPECVVGHSYLAEALERADDHAGAEASWKAALDRAPFEAGIHANLGSLYQDQGRWAEAEVRFRRAIELRPDFALAWHNLGDLLMEAPVDSDAVGSRRPGHQDLAAAVGALERAAELEPDNAGVLRLRGVLGYRLRDFEGAASWFRRALDLDPGSAVLHNSLGEALRVLGRDDEAEPEFRRALELDPDYLAPLNNLAIVLSTRGRWAEAEGMLRDVVDRQANGPAAVRAPALANLALVCANQGKFDEAEQFHREALNLAPDNALLANNLASFLTTRGRGLDEALDLARRAVRAAPDDPDFLHTLGTVHAQRGEPTEAERALTQALERTQDPSQAAEIQERLRQIQVGRQVTEP